MLSLKLPSNSHPCIQKLKLQQCPTSHRNTRLYAIIGIDLGTTNSAIAHVGKEGPEIIRDAADNATIPSLITITESDELLVGWAAANVSSSSAATTTFSSFKRLMGQKVADISFPFPFPIFEGDRGEALVYAAGADGTLTAVELSSWMLQHLIKLAERQLRESITGAVITVPAHFNSTQRNATIEAAKMAKIEKIHLLQEPVAAALAYGIDGGTDGETVLVFDIGGGTFDISILQAFEGIMQVLATGGDSRLGGDDFDHLMSNWLVKKLDNSILSSENREMVEKWALQAAKTAKESLAYQDSVDIPIPMEIPPQGKIVLTKEEFEEINKPLFERMAAVLEQIGKQTFVEWAMDPRSAIPSKTPIFTKDGTNSTQPVDKWAPPPRKISKIALVGQVTRLPSVCQFVEDLTGIKPDTGIDPGEVVALGAATQAGILVGSVGSVELMDGSFVVDLHDRVTGFSDWVP